MRKGLLIAVLMMLWTFTGGCYVFTTPPPRVCPVESLVLDAAPFPPGAIAEPLLSPLPRASWESAGRSINLKTGGGAIHDVYRYKTAGRAAREFERRKEIEFAVNRQRGPWEVPDKLSYHSPIANRYYIACGVQTDVYMCKMIAQYEEYYVVFVAHMNPKGMTFDTLERVLRAIDERMAKCLGKPLPTPRVRS